jgi:hypothetical protein
LADNGIALGAQAGEGKIKEIAKKAGFTKFRRFSQTPFNIVRGKNLNIFINVDLNRTR